MPINAIIEYLQAQANSPYLVSHVHPGKEFNLEERDDDNIYHLYISYAPTRGHYFVSVYYERVNWEAAFEEARNRLEAITQAIMNDERWEAICNALGEPTMFAEQCENESHGHFKFQFDLPDGTPPEEQMEDWLQAIKYLVDLLFENF